MAKSKKSRKINKKDRLYIIIATVVAIIIAIIIIAFVIKNNVGSNTQEEPINENFTWLLENESSSIANDDVFASQNNIYNEIMKTYKNGNYSYDEPYVIVNPSYMAPQTALVLFKTDKKEKVTITIKGKHDDDIVKSFEAATDHIIPLYGLYGSYDNKVTIETESGKKNTITVTIKDSIAMPSDINVEINTLGNTNGEFYYATSSLGYSCLAYDNYGEIRWYVDMGYTKGMTMLQNGNMLLSNSKIGPDVTSTSGLVEMDMLGFIYHEYEVEGGYHHDGYEMPDGNLLVLTSNLNDSQIADDIVLLDRNTGKIIKEWNLVDIVNAVDPDLIEYGEITWGWINSIFYDQTHNSLILSVRNQNSVVSIDYETGNINWILGSNKSWSNKFSQYMIKGVGSNFIYPEGQHSVYITDEGYLSIFNNGYDADKEQSVSCSSLKNNKSYAMHYKIDYDKKTAEVVWLYGGQEYFSYALSSLTYTKEKNKLMNSGWHFADPAIYNDSTCTQFSNADYDTYLIEFDKDNNIVLKMHIDESKFEVIKAPIYNLDAVSVKNTVTSIVKNYTFSGGSYTSTDEPKYETLTEEEALKYKTNEISELNFSMYNDRLVYVGSISDGEEFKITLISSRGTAYRFSLDSNSGNNEVDLSSLPSGRYYVYVDYGSLVFNTAQYVDL